MTMKSKKLKKDIDREEIKEADMVQPSCVVLDCRTIRIGSLKYAPKKRVLISTRGIRLVSPSASDPSKDVVLHLQAREIVKLLMHSGKGMPVLFIYTLQSCGAYVRKTLDMTDINGPYYSPVATEEQFKRITLLPYSISEENKENLRLIFGPSIDDLTPREANEILIKTCPKEVQSSSVKMMTTRSKTNATTAAQNANSDIRQILIYPPGKGGISINTEDYMCLAQDQFINDVIIDFYLKYQCHDILTPQQREKTHVFSTFFYKRLTTKSNRSNPVEWDSSLTPAQKRHLRVKSWTKNVNIFEKDFVVVPINENCHWFLAIICFPGLEGCRSMAGDKVVSPQEAKKKGDKKSLLRIGSTTITPMLKQEQLGLNCDTDSLSERDEAEAEESDLDMLGSESDNDDESEPLASEASKHKLISNKEPVKQPCILIFDSLAGASRSRVVATLRDYLTCEYHAKVSTEKKFTKDNFKGSCPKIPQQNNFTDCGLYLLQYVEEFFRNPITDYHLPIKQLNSWFDEIVVTRKREEISNLLKKLMLVRNGHVEALPEIAFPTLNGKLLEVENGEEGGGDSGKAFSETPDSSQPSPARPGQIIVNHLLKGRPASPCPLRLSVDSDSPLKKYESGQAPGKKVERMNSSSSESSSSLFDSDSKKRTIKSDDATDGKRFKNDHS